MHDQNMSMVLSSEEKQNMPESICTASLDYMCLVPNPSRYYPSTILLDGFFIQAFEGG